MCFTLLLMCVTGLTEGLPLAPRPPPSAPQRAVLIPVTVLSPYGPQVVLIPLNTADWNTQRSLNPTPQTITPSHQHQMKSENGVNQAESVNSPFLQPQTPPSPDTPLLPHTPESVQPQGQVFPGWNSFPVVPLQPSVTGQNFIPSLVTPAGGAGGQTQVVSVVRQALGSNSESSEEGDATQVVYLLPVNAEIPNMGIAEGGQGGADLNANTDPNLSHLQQPTPSPSVPAGLQESPVPVDTVPPTVGTTEGPSAGVKQQPAGVNEGAPAGTANPCLHKGRRANKHAKGPSL